jgi:hypothetical protein
MKFAAALSASVLAGSVTVFASAAAAQTSMPEAQGSMPQGQGAMPMDTPTPIGGIETVCTGVGEQAQNPHWLAYPVRIEFSNGGAQYLSGAHVALTSAAGKAVVSVDCGGPWVLFRVNPGSYKVTATLMSQPGGGTASATFTAPRSGQKRVVLDFKIGPNQ